MKKSLSAALALLISLAGLGQTITTGSKLVIRHPDMVLYLQADTSSMVSDQTLTYKNYLVLKSDRAVDRKVLGDVWFDDTYKGKFRRSYYRKTKRDLGHLTPFKATSYSTEAATNSFSCYNQAPQDADFNRHPWGQLEQRVLDSVGKYRQDARIITGVIYDNHKPTYLPKSRIKIPTHYYKILIIGNLRYYWLGDNTPGCRAPIRQTSLDELNRMFAAGGMDLKIGLDIKK